jgi:hypothetical protein
MPTLVLIELNIIHVTSVSAMMAEAPHTKSSLARMYLIGWRLARQNASRRIWERAFLSIWSVIITYIEPACEASKAYIQVQGNNPELLKKFSDSLVECIV